MSAPARAVHCLRCGAGFGKRLLIEEVWPAGLAQQLGAELGVPAGSMWYPGAAGNIERDLKDLIGAGWCEIDARRVIAAERRFQLGLDPSPFVTSDRNQLRRPERSRRKGRRSKAQP